jgi:C-terminal processing protease CtpA/Prc
MKKILFVLLGTLMVFSLLLSACGPRSTPEPTAAPNTPPAPAPTVLPTQNTSDEPALITGEFSYTNDFVTETYYVEHAMGLGDMTAFVKRDKEMETSIESQVLGYMKLDAENNTATFRLALPKQPEGYFNDVDNNGKQDKGLQIFAVSYWPNLYGDVFSAGDDRSRGWPSYLASVKTDSENKDEVIGGQLIIWAPDANQQFPTGFGEDKLLFTADDPVKPVPAGYSMIDLDKSPFEIVRQPKLTMTVYEPTDLAIKDFSADSYTVAFDKMFKLISKEYAFNGIQGKAPDWEKLYADLAPRVKAAEDKQDPMGFYLALQDFTFAFKDGHVGMDGGDLANQVFTELTSGGYGFAIRELDDTSVIVIFVLDGSPAALAGIQVGAVVTGWNGTPISEAIGKVKPLSAPFSTAFSERYQQARYLLRGKLGDEASVTFTNPGGQPKTETLKSVEERDSFSYTSVYKGFDSNALPVEYKILDSGVGYVKINSNYDDLNLIIRLFERALKTFEANQVGGLIIDMRQNSGGSPLGLAGFLTDQEIPMGQLEYYSDTTGKFEPEGPREKFLPNETRYAFPQMALITGQACASACEIESYGFSQVPGMIVVGQYPTGGVEAEVARGQFVLPEGMSLQVPTGRFTLPDGSIFLEGVGVVPTVRVPITAENALSSEDVVLKAAEKAVLEPAGAGITPSGPPRIGSTSQADAALATANQLEQAARETYTTAELSQMDKTFTYTIPLAASEDLIWIYGWCSTTNEIMLDNWKHIQVKFMLNGGEVTLNKFAKFEGENGGQMCRFYYTVLKDWPAGQHSVQTVVTFDAPINDGTAGYAAGTQTFQYDVFIKP